jgi:hypothetical protein
MLGRYTTYIPTFGPELKRNLDVGEKIILGWNSRK